MKSNWKEAARNINILRGQSNWSRCVQTHVYASLLYMLMMETGDQELKNQIREEIQSLPKLRRRIGGKTVPVEKLALYHSTRFARENESLCVPIYEIFYFYNIFSHTGGKAERIDPILEGIEKERLAFSSQQDITDQTVDKYCLLLLLKGACLRYKKCYKQAVDCFSEIIKL
jgi:hypothetical protein